MTGPQYSLSALNATFSAVFLQLPRILLGALLLLFALSVAPFSSASTFWSLGAPARFLALAAICFGGTFLVAV